MKKSKNVKKSFLLLIVVILLVFSSCAAPAGAKGGNQNLPPTAPVLTLPADGVNLNTGNITFSWQNSSDPNSDDLSYRIYISKEIENMNNAINVNGNQFAREFTAGESGTWFWRVEATDGKGLAVLSDEIRYFTLGEPSTVESDQHEDNELMVKDVTENSLNLEWPEFVDRMNPGYEVEYSVYVLEESNGSVNSRSLSRGAEVAFSATTTSRSMNINALMNNRHYRWMIMAAAQGGVMSKVGEAEFKTGNTPPATPILKQPGDGTEQIEIPLQLSWGTAADPDGDDVEYDVYVDTDSFPKTKVAKRIDETAISSEDFKNIKLSDGTTYYWRVVAKDGNGGYAVSDIFEFKTAGDASNNPTIEWISVPDAVVGCDEFTFEWDSEDNDGTVVYFEYKKDDFDSSSSRAHSIWKRIDENEYTWENIPNGEHTFSVRSIDDEGNYSNTITTCFSVDLGSPRIEWITQATGVINTSSFEFEWQAFDTPAEDSAREIIKYKFRKESYGTPENAFYDYGEWVFTEDTEYLWENIPEGRNRFIVKAKNDRYVYSEELICEFYYDRNDEGAPVLEWKTTPPEIIGEDEFRFEWIGSDNEESNKREIIEYQYAKDYFGNDRNGDDWETTTEQFYIWEEINYGKHSFSVRAVDDEGNFSEMLTAFFYKSGENPTVTWVEKPDDVLTEGKFTFEWNGFDSNGDPAAYYEFKKEKDIDSQQRTYGEWIKTSLKYFFWNGIPEGKHRFSVRAVDEYGNKSEGISVEFYCDLPKPVVEWVKKPAEEIEKNYFDFEWIGFEGPSDATGRGIIKYKYRKISWPEDCNASEERGYADSGWIFTEATGVRWENIPAGKHKMMVESKNDRQIYSDPIYAEFEYHPDPTKMPTVTWISTPAEHISDNSFTFVWQGNDPEESLSRSILKYEIARGDSAVTPNEITQKVTAPEECSFDWIETEESSYTWADIPAGWHYFAVRAKDDDGNYSEVILTDFVRMLPDILEWVEKPGEVITVNSFRFEWTVKNDENTDITGYEYCKDFVGGSSERVADEWVFTAATDCLWENISEGCHNFVVKAVFGDGSHSQLLRSVFEYEKTDKIPVVEWITRPSTMITDDFAEFEWRGFTETRIVDPDEVYAYEYKKISHDYINATTTESGWTDIQATGVTWEGIPVGYHRLIVRAYTFNQQYSQEIYCDFARIPAGDDIPVLRWTNVPDGEIEYDSFVFRWEGMDNVPVRNIIRYEIARGNMPPEGQIPDIVWEQVETNSYEWTEIIQGPNYFAVRAVDDMNNYSMPIYSIFLCRGVPTEVTDDLVFIHHSCGANWLNDGLSTALHAKTYIDEVNEIYYGTVMVPDENRPASLGSTPGDNTDMDHWLFWFNDYLDGILSEGSEDGRNRIVMFKSCYPNSAVTSDGSTETADPFSSEKTLENYKAVFRYPEGRAGYTHEGYDYKSLDKIFAENPNTIFIVVTSPPQCWDEADPENAARAREFNNWLKYHWIEFYQEENKIGDEYPRNVYIFDWFDFLACSPDDPNHTNMLKEKYGGDSGDSHPNLLANQESTEYFAGSQNNVMDYIWEDFNR